VNELKLRDRYEVVSRVEYQAVLDDFADTDGNQMVLMHIEVDASKFSASVMKRLLDDWSTFRSVTDAPIYGIEPNPDDHKWERFVSLLGFHNTLSRVDCTDGKSRRLFVSVPSADRNCDNERQQHADAAAKFDHEPVGSTDTLPH
jgi:hypothetical protein